MLVRLMAGVLACGLVIGSDDRWAARSWTTGDGLAHNSVLAIEQTDDGFLWVGTRGGLARFDGVNFETLGISDGLEGVDIAALSKDEDGGLWIGTFGGGLGRMKDGKLRTLTTEDGLAHNSVLILESARNGGVWVGSSGGLQFASDEKGLVDVGKEVGLPEGEILEMAADAQGGLWVGIEKHGLFYLRDGKWEITKDDTGVLIPYVRALMLDREGALWLSIETGKVLKFDGERWQKFEPWDGLPLSSIYCLAEDSEGRIWAGSNERGLYVMEDGFFERVETGVEKSPSDSIRALFAVDDLLFVGCWEGGLTRLLEREVMHYPVEADGNIYGFARDGAGDFLICSFGDGVFKGPLDRLEKAQNIPLRNALTGMTNSLGVTYVVGSGSIIWYEGDADEVHQLAISGTVISIAEGTDGKMFVGTRSGKLIAVEDGSYREVISVGVPISGLVSAGPGAWWLSTRGRGLFHVSEDGLRNWGKGEGLPTEVLLSLYEDRSGTLWIGTGGGGLVCLLGDRIIPLGTEGVLKNSLVTQIVEDEGGNLWLGTQRGIYRVARKEIEEVVAGRRRLVHPTLLNREDGLEIEDCPGGFHPAGLRAEDGRLYFSTVAGIATIDPNRYVEMAIPKSALIERVIWKGKGFKTRVLPPGVRDLEFHFTAFNYRNPDQIRFRYRVPQLDPSWVDVGSRREVNFPSLAAGDYRFEVNAGTGDGRWSEEFASYDFTVEAAFWETKWFQGLMGLCLVVIGGGVVWLVVRSRLKVSEMNVKLANEHAELVRQRHRAAELTELATLGELSASLAHEINQPLTGILSNAQAAKRFLARDGFDARQIDEILSDIIADDQRASKVIERVRGLLNKEKFVSEELEINPLVAEVVNLVKGDLEDRGITVVFLFDDGLPVVKGDRVQLQQVIINLVLNAADAMKGVPLEDRKLTIFTALSVTGGIEVSLHDRGHGIPTGDEAQIFESFHSTKDQGFGLGLSLSRNIVREHGGRMWAENNSGPGATVHFILPV
ncbi:MAG: two-component regulator propeller domain-containing protein [Verrucomicrobiaceae bacterium]